MRRSRIPVRAEGRAVVEVVAEDGRRALAEGQWCDDDVAARLRVIGRVRGVDRRPRVSGVAVPTVRAGGEGVARLARASPTVRASPLAAASMAPSPLVVAGDVPSSTSRSPTPLSIVQLASPVPVRAAKMARESQRFAIRRETTELRSRDLVARHEGAAARSFRRRVSKRSTQRVP